MYDTMAAASRPDRLVELYEHGEAADVVWFAMQYCDRGSLATHVRANGGRLGWADAAPLMDATLSGLAAAHSRGFVHRDVKPHNVLLTSRSGRPFAKVGDFGLAKSFGESGRFGMTATEGQAGSWPYMAREQLLDFRTVRPSTDVWSVAATFFEVLAGVPPRRVDAGQDPIAAVLANPAEPIRTRVPDLPRPIAAVFDRALRSDAGRRYADAGEFLRALRTALS